MQFKVQNNLAPHHCKEAIFTKTTSENNQMQLYTKSPDLSLLFGFVFLVQRFGFIPNSPSETVHCKTYFVSEGVSALLKHKENIYMCQRIKNERKEKCPEREPRETHLCFCLSVNPDHILSSGGPYKGAGLFVFFHCTVDGLLQSCWVNCTSLCICCVYHSAVCYLQKPPTQCPFK